MKTIKVSEAEDAALDYLVAMCEGVVLAGGLTDDERYCTEWAIGGPIIEREHIDIRHTFTEGGYRTSNSVDAAHAKIELPNGATVYDHKKVIGEYGPTPLIAAMRCYVTSKLGETAEVPEELL